MRKSIRLYLCKNPCHVSVGNLPESLRDKVLLVTLKEIQSKELSLGGMIWFEQIQSLPL